jgi:hypothetical protein
MASAQAPQGNYLVVPPSYPAGTDIFSVVLADFNGDGKLDAAVTNVAQAGPSQAGSVSILIGNGDGTFKPPVSYATDLGSQAIAVGDFNGDGKLDLVVANNGAGDVSILFGNGDGTFQPAVNYAAGSYPRSVAVGDFNGDGKLDIVVANFGANYFTLLLNNGDGTFRVSNISLMYGGTAVAVGDLNGDGKLDLVVGNNGGPNGVSVLLGNGNGTFQAAQSFGPADVVALALADLNGDGKLDIVAATQNSNTVNILLGNGDGTFQTGAVYTVPGASFVSVGDLNGDGKPDLVVPGLSIFTAVLIGSGDGTFQAPVAYASGGVTSAIGDLNGDHKLDFVSPGGAGLEVFLGRGDGTFPAPITYEPEQEPDSIAVGDLNGDGKLDFVTANYTSNTVSVFLGNGDGTFPAPVMYPTGQSPDSVKAGDLNGDGILDLVVANEADSTVSVFMGNGDGTFQPAVTYATDTSPTSVVIGDFNGDGVPDLAVANYGGGGLSILLGNGDGTFQSATNLSLGGYMTAAVAGDFNGDGKLDLALGGENVEVLLGNGDGTFQAPATYGVGNSPSSLAAADLNGDGKLDLLATNSGGVSILLNNGDGTFQTAVTYAAGYWPSSVVVSDFNGDGVPDIAVLSSAEDILYFLLGSGDGTFTSPQSEYPALGGRLASGDFTDSGVTDLIVEGNGASVYLNAYSPVTSLSTRSLTFGAQIVGTSSAPKTVTLTNTGGYPFTSTGISTTPDFTVSGACTNVTVGGTCTLSVEFRPIAPLTRQGSLTIAESSLAGSQLVTLSGVAIGPIGVLGTKSLSFPTEVVGTESPALQVTLTNAGNAALDIGSINTSGDFAQTNTCASPLAAGANCTISVTFAPTVAGTRSGTLTIPDDNDGVPGSTQSVSLTGTATAAAATVSPTSLSFNNVVFGTTSAPQTVTLTNTGSSPLNVTSVTVTAGFAQTNTCSAPIAGNGTCTISVTFTPSGAASTTGTLTIQSNASNSPNVVTLAGSEAAADLGVNTLALYFGNELVGIPSAPEQVSVTNVGNLPLTISSINTTSEFSETNNCAAALAPLASCTVNVTFTPTAAAQVTGTLTFVDNAPGSSPVVNLSGTGTTSYSAPDVYQLTPPEAMAGSGAFTLTVTGADFGPESVVNWNGSARATTFVNGTQLTASILASDLATPGTPLVTVVNPAPGGVTQYPVGFDVITTKRSLSFKQTDFPVGHFPMSVAMADFNGDGKEDLAVANYSDGTVSVLLGKGDGTFQPQVTYPTGLTPDAVAVGDFNGDGKLDLAVVNTGCPPSGGTCSGGSISVLLGNGDGTFQQPITTNADTVLTSLAVGDFNGDGRLDLAVGIFGEAEGEVAIYLGNGDGTFKAGATYKVGVEESQAPGSIVVADFNGDGKLDLATANGYGSNSASILLGNGDGTFQAQVQYPTGLSPNSIATADFNGDGKLDLVVANSDPSANTVSVLLGNGDGTFKAHVDYPTGVGAYSVTIGDFNGDKKLDLAVAETFSNTVSILLGNGDGTFQTNMDFVVGGSAESVVAHDFNGDGRLDLAVANGGTNTVSVLLQVGPEAALTPTTLTFTGQLVGSSSSAQTVKLENSGGTAMTITSIAASGDFAQSNTCGTSVAAAGNCTISVTFNPTASGARTGTLTITDNAPGSPHTVSLAGTGQDFSVGMASGSSSSATVTPGQTATYTLALTGLGGLSQTVSFACTGAPSESTCTVNPSSATPNASGPVSITVTVATTAPSLAAPRNRRGPPSPFGEPRGFRVEGRPLLVVLLVLLAWLYVQAARTGRKPRRNEFRLSLIIATLALLTLVFAACGGGSGSSTNPGTPAGSYTISITGSISGSTTLQHTTTLTLNVS